MVRVSARSKGRGPRRRYQGGVMLASETYRTGAVAHGLRRDALSAVLLISAPNSVRGSQRRGASCRGLWGLPRRDS